MWQNRPNSFWESSRDFKLISRFTIWQTRSLLLKEISVIKRDQRKPEGNMFIIRDKEWCFFNILSIFKIKRIYSSHSQIRIQHIRIFLTVIVNQSKILTMFKGNHGHK